MKDFISKLNKHFIKYLYVYIVALLFMLQTTNAIWCMTNPRISDYTTGFACFVDGWVFATLYYMLLDVYLEHKTSKTSE